MTTLPESIMQEIVSYLPYDERIEANKALPFQFRFVKKINSDSHNLKVKTNMITYKLSKIETTQSSSIQRVRAVKSLMTYLANTNDTALFSYEKFKDVVLQKANEMMQDDTYSDYIKRRYRHDVRSIKNVCKRLIEKLQTLKPQKVIYSKLVEIK